MQRASLMRKPTAEPPQSSAVKPTPASRASVGNQAALRFLQAKLEIGAADDPLEHEADRVAEQVMRMPAPAFAVTPAASRLSRKCAACEDEGRKLRTKPAGPRGGAGEAPGVVHEALRSPGEKLDAATRAFFEPRFGHDFGEVRVHLDDAAQVSAASVAARAYTVGAHIAFAEGAYAPHSDAGRRLLAHELAHTIQQGAGDARVQRQPGGSGQSKPACLPVIVNPVWNVGNPALVTKDTCTVATIMTFKGTVSMPTNCPGKVYFVQYVKPNRSAVACLDSKEMGFCINPTLGRDGSWPYAFGGQVNTDQDPGSKVSIEDEDAPGMKGLSKPDLAWVRFCQDDSFTTYIVFEDKAGAVTPLGWMSWTVNAHAERDGGTCPLKTTTADCAGWTVTGKGTMTGSSTTVGAMAPQQALDRSVKPVDLSPKDCDPSACPKAPAAAPPRTPTPAPSH